MGIINTRLCRRVNPSTMSDNETKNSLSNMHTYATNPTIPNINDYVVIWLQAKINKPDFVYESYISRLQRIFVSLHTFTNIQDCTNFLSKIKNEKILMIISNEFFEPMRSQIQSTPQIHSVYILISTREKKSLSDYRCNKVKGVYTAIEPIYSSLKHSTKSFKQDSFVVSIIPSVKYTEKDLQKLDQIFIYWMLVKQIVLDGKYSAEAVKNFTKFCLTKSSSNQVELQMINEFEENYYQHSPIWWYTREHFIYNMLNRAFQTRDVEILIRMEFFIKDIHQQLEELQSERQKLHSSLIVAYRTQTMSNEGFEQIKNNKGNFLTFNDFVIADLDSKSSLNSIRSTQKNDTKVNVVFRMSVKSKQTSSPYALLINYSYSSDKENCVLFAMHSVFHINGMKQIENQLWSVDLTLTESNNEHLTSLDQLLREETKTSKGWFKLAQLMSMTRDYDHSKDIYFTLLELTPASDELRIAHIYNELGVLNDQTGDYRSALSFYRKAIDIRRENLPPNHRSLCVSYNNIGEVQRQMGDYASALVSHTKTLGIKQKILPSNDLSFATTYNNIALANELLGEFSDALVFYGKALEIKQKVLPRNHQDLATTYNNIGELQRAMGNFSVALVNFEKALHIRLKRYSSTDPSLAITYNNIGLVHLDLGNFSKAISYLEKSLNVKLKNFPPDHSSLALTYNNIGDIHHQMGEYSKGLSSYEKALNIQKKVLTPNHPEIAITYTNMGIAHQAMGNYSTALSFYQKAIEIRQKALPTNHPLLAASYNNMGHLYQATGDYAASLDSYQKALALQQKTLLSAHPALATTYNNMGDIHRKLENYEKALSLYKKSLHIKEKSLPRNHPAFVVTYNNMGAIHQSLLNYSAALECYKQTLEIQKATLPENHPDLSVVYNNMGVTYQLMKEYSTALDYYKKALEIQEKTLPSNHPDIATIHNSMATLYVNVGDYKSALEHAKRAVELGSQTLPTAHPHLLKFKDYHDRILAKVSSMKKM